MIWALIGLLVGISSLIGGSEFVVNKAQGLARRFHISELVIGLTIVALGSSLPEIATNLKVGFYVRSGIEASGLAVGNILGSGLANLTLVAGLASLFMTLEIDKSALRRESFGVVGAFTMMLLAAIDGQISPAEGLFLCLIYGVYLLVTGRILQRAVAMDRLPDRAKVLLNYFHLRPIHEEDVIEEHMHHIVPQDKAIRHLIWDVLGLLGGMALLIWGADLVVVHGQTIAIELGVNNVLIGIFLGLGTSLPELVIAIRGVMRKADGIILGNLLGSNIVNPLLALGSGAIVAPLTVDPKVLLFEFPFLLVGTFLALLLLSNGHSINKKEGMALILFYGLFLFLSIFTLA